MIVSASALRRHCGYPRALNRLRKPTADQQAKMDRGTAFHSAVEAWANTGVPPDLGDLEMQGWVDLLAMDWTPPPLGEYEIAWGIAQDPCGRGEPCHVEVDEPAPHVYMARDGGELLTAGRADACWMLGGEFPGRVPRVDCAGDLRSIAAEIAPGDAAACVVDWKTGKWPTAPAVDNLQVNAAGIALAARWGLTSYVPGIYYARDGYWDWGPRVTFGTPAFDRIWGEIREAALLDETPRPGAWCGDCWERKTRRCAFGLPPDNG